MASPLRLAAIASLAIAALVAACGDTDGDPTEADPTEAGGTEAEPGGESAIDGRECPPDSLLTRENFGEPFLLTWCNACHSSQLTQGSRQGAPTGIDFDTEQGVQDHLQRIYARAGDENTTMPPTAGPAPEERALLGEWLACGAP